MYFLNKYKWHLIVFPILIALGVFSAVAVKNLNNISEIPPGNVGQVIFDNKHLPEIELFDFKNKKNLSSELQKGKILLIYISTDCNSCKKESEIIAQNNLAENLNIRVIGVSKDDESLVDEFIQKNKLNFPIVFDKLGKLREELGVTVFPANFVINDGIIEKHWLGASENFSEVSDKLKTLPASN
jgi:peroxiredoxin